MITFKIQITEGLDGRIMMNVQTPDTVATPAEIRAGLAFKKAFATFAAENNHTATRLWRSPNNESRNDQ